MKIYKYLLSAVLGLALCASVSAQTPFDLGLKGGIALNMMPGTSAILYDEFIPNIGFQGGAFSTFYLSDDLVGQVEVIYARKGVSTVNHTPEMAGLSKDTYSRNIHYLQVPLLIGLDGLADGNFRIMTGPEAGILLGSHIRTNTSTIFDDEDFGLNDFNLAWALQTTYFVTDALGIDFKLEYALTRTFIKETRDAGHNAAVQIGLSYRFGY